MLSSIAEKIYWLSRYIERIENTSRLINVNSDLLLDIPHDESNDLKHLIKITGHIKDCLLYTSPSPRDTLLSRMPSSA